MKKRLSAEQIVALLRQADVALGKDGKVPEVCKQMGISEQTYYRWRTKYGGMDPQMAKQLQELQKENALIARHMEYWENTAFAVIHRAVRTTSSKPSRVTHVLAE